MARTGRRRPPAFTLMELLVVITIIVLVSAVTLPAVLPALSHRQVSEAARILQAALVQARDTAVRFNAPRGVRFLPDPTYNFATTGILAYNRMVPIEPAPEYSNGMATIWPQAYGINAMGVVTAQPWANPVATYPSNGSTIGGGGSGYYPVGLLGNPANSTGGQVLVVEQAPFQSNDVTQFINAPTSWYWNIRVGDKIQLAGTGNTYTIVGPCTVNPFSNSGANPEMFVNVGQPGDLTNYLTRAYTDSSGNAGTAVPVEFLYLVNGVDDNNDGYVDSGWDGVDGVNNGTAYVYNGVADDLGNASSSPPVPSEWETETWQGSLAGFGQPMPAPQSGYNTTVSKASGASPFAIPQPMSYVITRRPVPSQGARETQFPRDVVVDVTTGLPGGTQERSRLPGIDPFSGYMDLLLLPSGQAVPTTLYSSPTKFSLTASFYNFWVAERGDVHGTTDLWGSGVNPNPYPFVPSRPMFLLPLPQDSYYYSDGTAILSTTPTDSLKGEWGVVTLFGRTGQITFTQPGPLRPTKPSGSLTSPLQTQGGSWNVYDTGAPFYDAQAGAREAK